MYTQEFVEEYVKSYKSNFKNFFVIQLIIDIILMAVFVMAILKFKDNESNVYIGIIVFIVLQQASFYINMKKWLGGLKGFSKGSAINKTYNDAVKDFNKTGDRALFDEKLTELELKIKEQ